MDTATMAAAMLDAAIVAVVMFGACFVLGVLVWFLGNGGRWP